MKKLLIVLLAAVSANAVAGNCTYPDDIAADGSICGGRAASVRPGGEVPPSEYELHQAAQAIVAMQQSAHGDYIASNGNDNPISKPDYSFDMVGKNLIFTVGSTGYVEAFKPTNTKNVFCDNTRVDFNNDTDYNIDCMNVADQYNIVEYTKAGVAKDTAPDFKDAMNTIQYTRVKK